MMKISVGTNIDEITKNLSDFHRKQIPFAASQTLNEMAYEIARVQMPKHADRVFDKGATPFTRRGFKYKRSTKRNLMSAVFIDSIQEEYMQFMVAGGTRFPDRKSVLVTTKHSKVNRYGNMTRGTYKKILEDKKKFFKGQPKGMPTAGEGIWERYGRRTKNGGQRIRLVALYKDSHQYQPIFPFGEFGEKAVFSRNQGIGMRFRRNLGRAIASAHQKGWT